MSESTERKYLCIEAGEEFTILAESIEDAREKASIWNGQVIKVLPRNK